MALTNLLNAVNKLSMTEGGIPSSNRPEMGYNLAKEQSLTDAKTALIAALASDSSLTGTVAKANVQAAINSVAFAIEAGQGRGDGSGVKILSERVFTETIHTQKALELALLALATPAV